ncbi:MAG TPA: TIGR02757 family protein [Thermodesulfobacteriota bacterium]
MARLRDQALKARLDALAAAFTPEQIAPDPLEFPRRYADPADREVAAFVASALAYGNVKAIRSSVADALGRMGPSPAAFVRRFDPARDAAAFDGFVHRFNVGEDLAALCLILRRLAERHGSLEDAFLAGDDPAAADVKPALAAFSAAALAVDPFPLYRGARRIPPRAGVRFFFVSPADGSACKRLNLFLRWVARPDDGIDLGLWRRLAPARLVIPLDVHVGRIARYIGLTRRRSDDWRTAAEITARLRRLDPADPVRYDFAICRLGILDRCPRRRDVARCAPCPLRPVCRFYNRAPQVVDRLGIAPNP